MIIKFEIPGEPVAQGRPRASTIGGRVRMYDPPKSKAYKRLVEIAAKPHAPQKPLEGPLSVSISVYRQIPKKYQTKPKMALISQNRLHPTTKPDIDNYVKGIKDGLNTVIWKDDSQIVELTAKKYYSDKPRVEVTITKLEESE